MCREETYTLRGLLCYRICTFKNFLVKSIKTAECVKEFVTNPDNLILVPGIHVMDRG